MDSERLKRIASGCLVLIVCFFAFLGLLLVTLMIFNQKHHWIDISVAKGQKVPPERFTAWNSFSRIGVQRVDSPWNPNALWTIIIDGDAGTGIARFDWSRGLSEVERLTLRHDLWRGERTHCGSRSLQESAAFQSVHVFLPFML